jgi:hypothetical protein
MCELLLCLALSTADLERQWAYTALHFLDYRQTRNLITTPGLEEKNFILGPNPSARKVDAYFATTLLAHWAITYSLPPEYRKPWQLSTIIVELAVIGHNKRLGLSFNF